MTSGDEFANRKERGALRQEAKRGAGVLRVNDAHVVTHDLPALVQRDVLFDPDLRDAIEGEDQDGDARDESEAARGHDEILGGKVGRRRVLRNHASVHNDDLPGDVRGLVRDEERDGARDVVNGPESSERDLLQDRLFHLLQ